MNQTERGKAFEYALAHQISVVTRAPLDSSTTTAAENFYRQSGESGAMDRAASEAALFLQSYDSRFADAIGVRLQPDAAGIAGDVRDVIISTPNEEIGLSAKNNHQAIKHSRLSSTIDFGLRWADHPVSNQYWNAVTPIFDTMSSMRSEGLLFRNIPNKAATFYLPILTAFEDEFRRLCEAHGTTFISRVFRYLIGLHDFYKVVRSKRYVQVQPFNMNGSLEWGRRWTVPSRIEQLQRRPRSNNTLLVSFEGGWQLSFRLHNASARVEPSLKFDIQFVGMPVYALGNQIPLSQRASN